MNKLCNIIYPDFSICNKDRMYFKVKDNFSIFSYSEERLYINKGGHVNFDTYFNAFSLEKWQLNTSIKDLYLCLKIKGKVQCSIFQFDENHNEEKVVVTEILSNDVYSEIEIPSLKTSGIIYFKLQAFEDCELLSGFWGTKTEALNKVKLGLSITTYNRIEDVKITANRILSFLNKGEIDAKLIIVDNGRNVQLKEDIYLTYIENENLGGSGGYARGLYHLKEENDDFTHCLFMDDDVVCDFESIYRAYKMFEYSCENLAISGSLLYKESPTIIYESGGTFDKGFKPLKTGLNMIYRGSVLDNEKNDYIDYGGWWFFAFPINNAQYPYPFFVRGDDVNYGLQKQFQIISLNGICTWGEDFLSKETPLTMYLDIRSLILNNIQQERRQRSFGFLKKLMFNYVVSFLRAYKYERAQFAIEGLKDVLKGPEFFEKNINMKKVFPRLSTLNKNEKQTKINLGDYPNYKFPGRDKKNKILRKLTLNGNLLPSLFFRSKNIILPKNFKNKKSVFRRRKVLYYQSNVKEGFIVVHNKKTFFKLLYELYTICFKYYLEHKKLRKQYLDRYNYLTSKEYWEKQFFNS